ncbi:MAG TPA: hypothetical protein ENN55_01860 [Firmicutes bacterium]|nr:hypothetical protein [Bacillota bacterium]
MSAMKLIEITDAAKNDMRLLPSGQLKKVHEFIYHKLSRRTKPMDEYEDTYRVKANFFKCNIESLSIYFEKEPRGKLIIARITAKTGPY